MQRTSPKVSVIVPIYNVVSCLKDCLDSIASQSLDNLEVILVIDGATDGSGRIAEDYERRYAHFHCVIQDNQGLSAARNTGLHIAKGEYIVFIDSDDKVTDDAFERLYENASANNSDLVVGNAWIWNSERGTHKSFYDDRDLWSIPHQLMRTAFRWEDYPALLSAQPAAWKKFYRRAWLVDELDFRFPVGKIYEDVPGHFRLLLSAQRISVVREPFYFYRVGRPGQITTRCDQSVFDMFVVFRLAHDILRELDAPPEAWARCMYMQMRFFRWLSQRAPADLRDKYYAEQQAICEDTSEDARRAFHKCFGRLDRLEYALARRGAWRRWQLPFLVWRNRKDLLGIVVARARQLFKGRS